MTLNVVCCPGSRSGAPVQVIRTTRCDGLINEYQNAAWPGTTEFRARTVHTTWPATAFGGNDFSKTDEDIA